MTIILLIGWSLAAGKPVVPSRWQATFDRLTADDPAALDLLTALAWCCPETVPLRLFTEHPDVLPVRLRHAVADPLALS